MEAVRLADLWQRRGFMNMPDWMCEVLAQAFASGRFREEPSDVRAVQAYRSCVDRWREGGVEFDPDVLEKAGASRLLVVQYSPPQFTIADVTLEVPGYRNIGVSSGPGQLRWRFYPFAFGIYWALFYHIESAYLARPKMMWDELLWVARRVFCADANFTPAGEKQLWLALLERTLGMEYDRRQELPHYIANISQRPGLRPEELEERVRVFDFSVSWMKKRLLRHLA